MNFDLKFYARLLVRRAPVMLLLFLVSSAVGLVVAARLPTTYETAARLVVQPQQIAENLAAPTVRINALEEIRLLQEQLMTRNNLIEIANRHDVFEGSGRMQVNAIVSEMRGATNISASGGRSNQPVLMRVRFEARTPQIAADVVNDYVTRILAENARIRTGAAGETLGFFEQEVRRLSAELDARSSAITEFQRENADALPSDQDFRMRRMALLQERVSGAERERRSLQETRGRTLEVFEATGQVPGARTNSSPEERELAGLEDDLARALTVFSETSPRVQQLQRRITLLREQITGQVEVPAEGELTGAEALLNLQLTELDAQIDALSELVEQAEAELAVLEDAVGRTPQNAITLEGLRRDFENIRSQYDSAVQRLAQASVGERIEVSARGQRITLIEPAAVPSRPASPNRAMIAGGGIGLGLMLAAGFFLLMELLNRTVRRPVEIINRLGIEPLAVLPYMESRRDRLVRRSLRVAAALIVLLGVPAGLWAIDTHYMPLDRVADRVIDGLGLG